MFFKIFSLRSGSSASEWSARRKNFHFPFTRKDFYAILYMKSTLDFGKGDSFARNGFRMAFRYYSGNRS